MQRRVSEQQKKSLQVRMKTKQVIDALENLNMCLHMMP